MMLARLAKARVPSAVRVPLPMRQAMTQWRNARLASLLVSGSQGPIPSTFAWLTRNIAVNGLGHRVQALNLGLGRGEGRLGFTGGLDTVNHVLAEDEVADDVLEVPVRALDAVLDGRSPTPDQDRCRGVRDARCWRGRSVPWPIRGCWP